MNEEAQTNSLDRQRLILHDTNINVDLEKNVYGQYEYKITIIKLRGVTTKLEYNIFHHANFQGTN